MRIAFLPLDERPVTRDAFLQLGAIAGAEVTTPARQQLGSLKRPADVDALWAWLEGPGAMSDVVIASAEVLIYGGLVPSRVGREPLDRCLALAARWGDVRRAAPGRRVYLSASNLRLPDSADAAEEPDYWTEYGPQIFALSFHEDRYQATGDAASRERAATAAAAVPAAVLADVRWRRARNLAVLLRLVDLAGAEVFDGLLIGQDDTAEYGWTRRDLRAVAAAVEERAGARAWVTYGTDELTARLLARAVVTERSAVPADRLSADSPARMKSRPAVRVTYSAPRHRTVIPRYEGQALDLTVTSHVVTAACRRAESGRPDLALFVHNSPGDQLESPDQEPYPPAQLDEFFGALGETAAAGVPCVLADVRYSNGADRTLVERLLAAPNASDVLAYGGWNTASNTLGMALAQGLLSSTPTQPANRDFTILRLLDDWGYQAVVRQRLVREVVPRFPGAGSSVVGPAYEACAEAARRWLQETCVPPISRSFGVPVQVGPVGFPWNRLFHVALDLRIG